MSIQKISHKPYDLMAQRAIEGNLSTRIMEQMEDRKQTLRDYIVYLKKDRDELIARAQAGENREWIAEELGYLHGMIEQIEKEIQDD